MRLVLYINLVLIKIKSFRKENEISYLKLYILHKKLLHLYLDKNLKA